MCGIFGVVNGTKNRGPNNSLCKLIEQAFITGALRGEDSAGLFQYDGDWVYTHKAAGNAIEFANSEKTYAYIKDVDTAQLTVCHNRAATEGVVNDANAHPFDVVTDDRMVVGVHNGTLRDWKTKPDASKFKVDSEWAISRIAAKGDDAFKEIFGAFTFVWFDDTKPNVLNMVRNHERPMFFTYVKGEDRMLFASEYMMLYWLAQRNNITLEDTVVEMQPGYIYSFNVANPREFVKKTTPYPVYTAPDRSKEFIAETIKILCRKKTTVTKESTAQSSNVIDLTRRSFGTSDRPAVLLEGKRRASDLGVYHAKTIMEIDMYDQHSNTLFGKCHINGKPYSAVIERVLQADFDTWRRAGGLECRVIGYTPSTTAGEDGYLTLARGSVVPLGSVLSIAGEETVDSSSMEEAMHKALVNQGVIEDEDRPFLVH